MEREREGERGGEREGRQEGVKLRATKRENFF